MIPQFDKKFNLDEKNSIVPDFLYDLFCIFTFSLFLLCYSNHSPQINLKEVRVCAPYVMEALGGCSE